MPFAKDDPNINRGGRPKLGDTKLKIKRNQKKNELSALLRKLKPHVADAINTAAKVMKSTVAKDTDKLKAAVILLDNYKQMVGEVYVEDQDDEEDFIEESTPTPAFSLHVMNGTPVYEQPTYEREEE